MVVIHDSKNSKYSLKIDYQPLLGTDWCGAFREFLKCEYMSNLMISLNEKYKKETVYPKNKNNIFKAFKMTRMGDLRVVFIDCKPQQNNLSNGLAFGNNDSIGGEFSSTLIHLHQELEYHSRNGLYLDFDYTLEEWAHSGVLLLNKYLTFNHKDYHTDWVAFTKYVVKIISDYFVGLTFVFFNEEEQEYSSLVNKDKHLTLFTKTLNYEVLKKVNNEIEYVNGEEERIKW